MTNEDRIEQMFDELKGKLDDIYAALHDPDSGVYSRIRTVADDVADLQQWKLKIEQRMALLFGSIVTTSVGLVGKFIYDFIVKK